MADTVVVEVLSVAGTVLLGPEPIAESTCVQDLKERLLATTTEVVGVELLDGDTTLGGDTCLRDLATTSGSVRVSATFFDLELSSDEEHDCRHKLMVACGECTDIMQLFREMPLAARADKELTSMALRGDKMVITAKMRESRRRDPSAATPCDPFRSPLEYAHVSLRGNREIVTEAVQQSGRALQYAHNSFKTDRGIVELAVKQNGLALEYADKSLQADKALVLLAVANNAAASSYAHESLKGDADVLAAARSKK